jgi:carbon-monoxide dehydrogenase large subunit
VKVATTHGERHRVGEAGWIGIPPAAVNAVVDALTRLGVIHLDMPLTPARLWQALREAGR